MNGPLCILGKFAKILETSARFYKFQGGFGIRISLFLDTKRVTKLARKF